MVDETTVEFGEPKSTVKYIESDIVSIHTAYVDTITTKVVTKDIKDPDTGEFHTWSREVALEEPKCVFEVTIEGKGVFTVGDYYVNTQVVDAVLRCVTPYLLKGSFKRPQNHTIMWGNVFALLGSEFKESTKKDESNG